MNSDDEEEQDSDSDCTHNGINHSRYEDFNDVDDILVDSSDIEDGGSVREFEITGVV